ncbi:PssD/Cps14F family polysaccharide biosynthesis glycosyltransferase [Photobacterium carnosum]|uniref:PssD/Cps14F family polysaccharide biosynthesis glycosyltransferase n=1 Tax=Photobacterium carnosum TaxID=2023717 RepID=UPI001E41284A|nr:PssD/Cps14F family polysaccharide biosynthesis glycosyltransferase [Photobacterium carnosum]MCD9497745.1 polysaccharide biosynthesis protein [Photobacterium carnosum]
MKEAILFCYGSGGHKAQMERLGVGMNLINCKQVIVTLSDDVNKFDWSDKHYISGELRDKYSHFNVFFNKGPLSILYQLYLIKKEYKITSIVSTGPGVSLVASLFYKMFNVKIVHIETWSRFKTKSLTGRIAYLIADKFYIQNESLKSCYPKAIYSGRL